MKKVDRRILRTRRMLGEALIELILEKGFDAVTIRDITDRADIAYATFYRHYDGKEDLLINRVKKVMSSLEEIAQETSSDYFQVEGILLFEHVEAKQDLYRSLLGSKSNRYVIQQLKEMIMDSVRERAYARYKNVKYPAIPLDVLVNHTAVGTLELIAWWLENDKKYSIERMADIYKKLVIDAAWQSVESKSIAGWENSNPI